MLDDVLDVSSLQGVPGIVGTLLVAFFADPRIGGSPPGLFYGGDLSLLWHQIVGVVCCTLWAAVLTFFVLKTMKLLVHTDVSPLEEEQGLDLSQVGEQAYDDRLDMLDDLGESVATQKLCHAAALGNIVEMQELLRSGAKASSKDCEVLSLPLLLLSPPISPHPPHPPSTPQTMGARHCTSRHPKESSLVSRSSRGKQTPTSMRPTTLATPRCTTRSTLASPRSQTGSRSTAES